MFKPRLSDCSQCHQTRLIVVKKGLCHTCNEKRKGKPLYRLKPTNRNAYANSKFYRQAWEARCDKDYICHCEECGKPLTFSPFYVSHNLTKSWARLRADKENFKILCFDHHRQWETGDRKSMKVYDESELQQLRLKNYPV